MTTGMLDALEHLFEHGGWLAQVALAAWALALVVPVFALLGPRSRSLAFACVAVLVVAWLASVAMQVDLHHAILWERVRPRQFWIHLHAHFATLRIGGGALLLATCLSGVVVARERRAATALAPFVLLAFAALVMVLYPLDFLDGWGDVVQDFDVAFERRHEQFASIRAGLWLVAAIGGGLAVSYRLRNLPMTDHRSPVRVFVPIAMLLGGAMAFFVSRGHAHDAAHPLPPHHLGLLGSLDREVGVPHPDGVACGPRLEAPLARLKNGVHVSDYWANDLPSLRRALDTLDPGDPLALVRRWMLLYQPPTERDADALAELARHGFDDLHLLTLHTRRVVTATRGEIELHQVCTIPLDASPVALPEAVDDSHRRDVD